MGLGAQRQALPQLAQLRLLQSRFEFRLSHQNDLQEFFGKGLEVGKHADLFEHLVGKVLGLVNDQDGGLAGTIAVEQPTVEALQELALGQAIAGKAEIGHHVVEELRHVQPRVEDEGGGDLLQPEPFHQLVDRGSFAGSHLTGEQHEALAALYAVGKASERLFGVPREKQVTRVRIDVERVGSKSEKFF